MKAIWVFLKTKRHFFYVIFLIVSLLPFFFPEPKKKLTPLVKEQFNPHLKWINSVDKLTHLIESKDGLNTNKFDTATYVLRAENLVQQRFCHGLALYSVSENWIAHFLGEYFWNHFSAIVIPNHILRNEDGLCSQQAIVFMEVLRLKGIRHRSIGLGGNTGEGHFLTEVFYGGSWHLHDVNLEPDWKKLDTKVRNREIAFYMQNKDLLYKAYECNLDKDLFGKLMTEVKYGDENTYPAKNMRIFHIATQITTYFIPFVLLLASFRSFRRLNKSKKSK